MDGHGCIVPVHLSANTASLFGHSAQVRPFSKSPFAGCRKTHKHQIHGLEEEWKQQGGRPTPRASAPFLQSESQSNVSNSPKGNDSKNNPDDLLYLASFMFTTKQRGQSRVHQTHNPMQGTQHEPCWPGSSCCICRVLLRFKWGDLAENVYDDHMPPTYCFPGAQPPPHQRTWKSYWKQPSNLTALFQPTKHQWGSVWNCPSVLLQKIGSHILSPFGLLLQVEDSRRLAELE